VTHGLDHEVVLYVQDKTENSVSGWWYVDNYGLSKQHRFVAKSESSALKELRSDSLVFKLPPISKGDTLTLELLMDGGWSRLNLIPWVNPVESRIDKKCQYYDSLYAVRCDTDVVYARARGYWTSYPEPIGTGDEDYWRIVREKMNRDDLNLKQCDLTMDIYSPVSSESIRRPLLLLIHGGSFFNGDKKSIGYSEWAEHFASRGYVVASINYRIGFRPLGKRHLERAGYRAVQDARAAIFYLLHRPKEYSIDPNLIFVGGSSAGGITALNVAFMKNEYRPVSAYDPKNEDLGSIDAVANLALGVSAFRVNAVVNMWGAIHDLRMLEDKDAWNTAILSFHGDADSVVSYGYDYPFTKLKSRLHVNEIMSDKMFGSKCIHEKAREMGMKSELYTEKNGKHSLHVDNGVLTNYYTFITNTTTRFLYHRIFPFSTLSVNYEGGKRWYVLNNTGGMQTCNWEVLGGLVLEAETDRARVIFFADQGNHKICIDGKQEYGKTFHGEYDNMGNLVFWTD
jgi:dienelactone hydrolase